ncbi:MAG TPA: hypothetical protein VFB13_09760 [Reyranella sp.]|nr:hypothetical protein [Reyranella sp.]
MRRTFLSLLLLGVLPPVALAQSNDNKSRGGRGGPSGSHQAEKQQSGGKSGGHTSGQNAGQTGQNNK